MSVRCQVVNGATVGLLRVKSERDFLSFDGDGVTMLLL